jgi:hypothetical protein
MCNTLVSGPCVDHSLGFEVQQPHQIGKETIGVLSETCHGVFDPLAFVLYLRLTKLRGPTYGKIEVVALAIGVKITCKRDDVSKLQLSRIIDGSQFDVVCFQDLSMHIAQLQGFRAEFVLAS